MQIYDKQKLMEALKEMAEAEPAEDLQDLKKLFLLMAREKRMLKQTTMEDIADLFNNASSILELYYDNLDYILNVNKLKDYKNIQRRAV